MFGGNKEGTELWLCITPISATLFPLLLIVPPAVVVDTQRVTTPTHCKRNAKIILKLFQYKSTILAGQVLVHEKRRRSYYYW